jgi:outer membrane protein insertion porin family
MRKLQIPICCLLLVIATVTVAQQGEEPVRRETFQILGISVEGNTSAEPAAVIANSGLKIGDEITIPGDDLRQTINRLWALRLFADVQVSIENQVGKGVYLLITVQEHPRLERVDINGSDDVSESDIRKKITSTRGQILTPQEIAKTVKNVKKLYEEEGHLLAQVSTEMVVEDSARPNRVVLVLNIDEGTTVKVDEIRFEGNEQFSDGSLRGEMEETKENVWWMFWRSAKFDKKKYEEDKDRVVKYYQKNGYIDAEILSDSLWYSDDKRRLHILISIHEGPQYKVRNIAWEGNTVYSSEVLSDRLGFQKGDVYNVELFEKNLRMSPDQNDVASLYLDNGYLTFNLEPEIRRVAEDSVDITTRIYERNQFRIGRVDILGNSKTKDKVIRRELHTRPGDFYNQSAVIRSLRQLSQLNYFNPEKLFQGFNRRIVDEKTVDISYEVEEKSSDNINASVGYSGVFGVTGALGFTINNFDIAAPLEGGAGQVLNFQWEFGEGARFRTFSVGFTEPWLFDTPTSLGISAYDTRQRYAGDFRQTGASVRLGRRFRWPDDYFRGDWIFRTQINNVIDPGFYNLPAGKSSQFSITQIISRNSSDSPIFPSIGSNFSLSVEMSGGPFLPGDIHTHKWVFSGETYVPMFGSSRLVLYTSTLQGFVGKIRQDTKINALDLFVMGGTGLGLINVTPLRGYDDRSIAPGGGFVMTKHTAELRLALALNPIPIYLLGFVEGGNVFENFKRADFLDLKRSYGFGARLLINPIGMVGFDYGYGADDVLPKDGKPDGWRFHFQFGRGF